MENIKKVKFLINKSSFNRAVTILTSKLAGVVLKVPVIPNIFKKSDHVIRFKKLKIGKERK